MVSRLTLGLHLAVAALKSRRYLILENLALRHQLPALSRCFSRPRLTPLERALWVWLSHSWKGWKTSLRIFQPNTVMRWRRAGFRLFWRWKSRPRATGRKSMAPEIITLIRQMSHANPPWGAPRIHGEWLKLGITLDRRTVAQYMAHCTRPPPSQNWKAFLRNHLGSMVSVDFLTIPTVTFHVLYVFIVLSHHRRAEALGWEEVRIAPRSPWQSPDVAYHHRSRTHLSLDKDAPEARPVQGPQEGNVVVFAQVGRLHHRYERLAA